MNFLMIATVAVFVVAVFIYIKQREKHDRVLFSFSRLQSAVMKDMITRSASGTLTRLEYESAVFLLSVLDGVTSHYDQHKTTMFNLRKMRQMVEQDLAHYQEVRHEVRERLAEVPSGTKIAALYDEFERAAAEAFLAYTPFIRTEIILRLLLGDIAKQVDKIRHELPAGKVA